MKHLHDVVIKPIISERSSVEASQGKYTFVVALTATKTEIRQAVEHLFGVKVLAVNTANYIGKTKRMGVHVGKRADYKKAIVTIDLNPAQENYLAKGGKSVSSNKKYKTAIEEFGFAQ